MKILIVDDEKISRKILIAQMKPLGTCVAVDSTEKALEEMKSAASSGAPFDLISLDVSMPGMDGRKMLQHIRKREVKKKIPKAERAKILMITARMNMETIKACIKLGCNGYLTKPVSRVQILESLGKMGFDTQDLLKGEKKGRSHAAAVADIINRFYSGKIALPVFPHIVQEVEDLISGEDPSIEDLGKIVEKDIVITAKLISIANSPLYKGVDIVQNLNVALVRLGMKTTRSVISAVAAKNLFDSANASLKEELDRLWLHSFAVATLAKQLGEAAGIEKIENLFLMGIIHDIGKMLLMKAVVDIYPDTSISDKSIQLAIHEIHTTFGSVLIKKMRFSQEFIQVAEFHHWNRFEKQTEPALLVVSLADLLAVELGFSSMSNEKPPGEEDGGIDKKEVLKRISDHNAVEYLGLTPQVVLGIGEKAKTAIKDSARAF